MRTCFFRYDGVDTDIIAGGRKLRPGGSFIFNDYGIDSFPGVTRAVDDFAKSRGASVSLGRFGVPPGTGNAALTL